MMIMLGGGTDSAPDLIRALNGPLVLRTGLAISEDKSTRAVVTVSTTHAECPAMR
jgi:hypothetical protein